MAVAALFMVFAYRVSDLQVVKGYEINARFLKVGGLNTGADVRINGIKVGTVLSQSINPADYMVDVKMSLRPDISLPADSAVMIAGDGLMGDKFIKIEPGTSAGQAAARRNGGKYQRCKVSGGYGWQKLSLW